MESLRQAAAAFVGAVTESARMLAEGLEREIRGDDAPPAEPRTQLLWACLLFSLHLTDRFAFVRLGLAGRELFMAALLADLAKDIDEELLRTEYNAAQEEYSAFKTFLPEASEGFGRTLCWEFAKRVCGRFCPGHPELIPLLTFQAADAVVALGKTFEECVPVA